MSPFKDCDIRGIYPTEIDEALAHRIGRALAALHPGARVCVGGDVRDSTPALKAALIDGLTRGGIEVWDVGGVPTPALYFAIGNTGADGGAMVTASHNPAHYNGIKLQFGPLPVDRAAMDALAARVAAGDFPTAPGRCVARPILPAYLDDLVRRFRAPRPLRVVLDAGNGAMGGPAPKAFRRAGHEVVELYCEPDGRFPNRAPNPADPGNLAGLQRAVVAHGADLGVAFDGDGDRCAFVDETGRVVLNEAALVLFIRALPSHKPVPVVYDYKCSSAVRRAILEMGGEPIVERTGHAFVQRRFLERNAALAGEASGHFFFNALGYDDGLFAALTMARLLCASELPLSRLVSEIRCPPITPDLRLPCPYAEQDACLAAIERLALSQDCEVSHPDGILLTFPDGWLLARKSVTAEQLTLRAEAQTPERLEALLALAADALPPAQREALEGRVGE